MSKTYHYRDVFGNELHLVMPDTKGGILPPTSIVCSMVIDDNVTMGGHVHMTDVTFILKGDAE